MKSLMHFLWLTDSHGQTSNMHNQPRHDCFEVKEVHAGQNEKDYLGFYSI